MEMMTRKKRRIKMKVTIRADTVEIEGYVNAVGRDSRMLTDEYGYPFVERITPGTFGKALEAAKKAERSILCLLDHDQLHEIGSTDTNLELEEDSIGLHARAVVSDPETIQAAREKRLSGWSFGFNTLDYRESYSDGVVRRSVTELNLVEVSVIDDKMTPCYAGTSIHARADENKETIYTRATDQEVEYVDEEPEVKPEENTQPEEKTEEKPQERAEQPEEKPEEEAQPVDYSYYKNRIELLKLG